jgi:hypothetical protein
LSPTDLNAGGYTGALVEEVIVNSYYHTVLKAPEGWGYSTVALPKGWGSASSLTYKIYWTVVDDFTPNTGNTNTFVISSKGWVAGTNMSTAPCSSGCNVTANSPLKNKLQVTTHTQSNGELFTLTEGQLLQVWFGRLFESTLDVNVYVYGVQITANS